MTKFSAFVKLCRQLNKLSQRKAAELLGINFTYISKIESGQIVPSAEVLDKMQIVYKCDRYELYSRAAVIPREVRMRLLTPQAMRAVLDAPLGPSQYDLRSPRQG